MTLISRMKTTRLLVSLLAFVLAQPCCCLGAVQTEQTPPDVITDAAATRLLSQVAEGLQGHSSRKMLATFDLLRMNGGELFKQQITAFFNQYETIRVHFKFIEVAEGNVVVADAEMEMTPRDAITPPQHKSLQLRLTAEKESTGWRFIDVQPRGFFS